MGDDLLKQLCLDAIALDDQALQSLEADPLPPSAVHDCRVSCKQLRARWQLLRPWLDREQHRQADHTLRDGARALAGARDHHVLATTLEKLAHKADKSSRQSLLAIRDSLFDVSAPAPPVSDHHLAAQAFRADRQHWQALTLTLDDHALLVTGLARTYKQSRNRANKAMKSDNPAAWHALRKWVKYLLYQLWSLGLNQPSLPALEKLGNRLGKLHDLHVLEEHIRANADRIGKRKDLKLALKTVAHREAALLKQCHAASQHLFAAPTRQWIRQVMNDTGNL